MGLSAATGHLADNHDILGVSVRNLDPDAQYFDSEQVCILKFSSLSTYSFGHSVLLNFQNTQSRNLLDEFKQIFEALYTHLLALPPPFTLHPNRTRVLYIFLKIFVLFSLELIL